jgi:hypothetical protein
MWHAQYDAWMWCFLRNTSIIRCLDLQEENNASSTLGARTHTSTHTPTHTLVCVCVAMEKQWAWNILIVCVFSLSCHACTRNAHAPYCHLWPARCYNTYFCTLSHKLRDSSANFVWHVSNSTKNWARYDQTCESVCTYSTLYIGLHVQYSVYRSARTVLCISVCTYSTLYIGQHVQSPVYRSARTVPCVSVGG